ncbi:MAG: ammonium transporter [Acidiferrobacterales bacterium]|jgi:Amt family ammonium transporter|nr:ammonium transporter [Acidiferrobacterales bacterium]
MKRTINVFVTSAVTLILLLLAPSVFAADELKTIQISMDMVWVITAGALVFFMQAGFAFVESGMARSKNAVNVIMKNYTDVCFGTLIFWLFGYGLMFGANESGWIGTDHFMLHSATSQELGFLFFQTMFAATAATIASGAVAERTRYWPYIIGSMVITGVIYAVYGSWAWGSHYDGTGWLAEMGFIDFAGSTVVHSVGGWAALAGIIVVGPRLGKYGPHGEVRTIPGHNLSSVALGGFILWLGWFGFNAGSTVAADVEIGPIAMNTHLAAAAGAAGAVIMMALSYGRVYMTTAVNGSLGGLVGITAGCATMQPGYAVVTGIVAGMIVVVGNQLLDRFKLDDVVGAVPVHGLAGAWGTLAAGMFKTGDLFNPDQIVIQLIGIAAAFLWAFPTSLLTYWILDGIMGMRADSQHEQRGLDFTEHHEIGYPEFQQKQLHKAVK